LIPNASFVNLPQGITNTAYSIIVTWITAKASAITIASPAFGQSLESLHFGHRECQLSLPRQPQRQ
jgi:hypothetical protein